MPVSDKLKLDIERYFSSLQPKEHAVRECPVCETRTADTGAAYCHMCGASPLREVRVDEMIYKSIQTGVGGKALMCPHCDNEELSGGDYCMICGSEVVNRCAEMKDEGQGRVTARSCENILPGNARFCPRCGNESSYYQKGWLKDWSTENIKKAIRNIHASTVDFNDLRGRKASGSED